MRGGCGGHGRVNDLLDRLVSHLDGGSTGVLLFLDYLIRLFSQDAIVDTLEHHEPNQVHGQQSRQENHINRHVRVELG